jgi:hypothetical protein
MRVQPQTDLLRQEIEASEDSSQVINMFDKQLIEFKKGKFFEPSTTQKGQSTRPGTIESLPIIQQRNFLNSPDKINKMEQSPRSPRSTTAGH